MDVVESLDNKKNAKYAVTFLRGRKEGSHVKLLEIVDASDIEQALDVAFCIAKRTGWHVEKVERDRFGN